MTDSYDTIIKRLLPIYEKEPDRFMRFYNAVWLMCYDLPEGDSFRIADRCAERNIPLFRDIVALCIMDEPFDIHRGNLEFSDDMECVRRYVGMRRIKKKTTTWNPVKKQNNAI